MEIVLTVGVFLISFFSHIVVHRILVKLGIRTFVSEGIFLPGLFLLAIVFFRTPSAFHFPISSFLFYLLLWVFHAISFSSAYIGDQPSSRILFFINRSHKVQYGNIARLFSDHELVGRRLDDLLQGRLVLLQKNRLKLLPRGKRLDCLLSAYRRLLRWDAEG